MRIRDRRAPKQLDRLALREQYGWLIRATVAFFILAAVCGGIGFGLNWAMWREFGSASEESGEAVCVRSQLLMGKTGTRWHNTFRLSGADHLSVSQEGCAVGRRYQLTYLMGKSGMLRILNGNIL